jgi:hypothetical protein
VVYADEKDVTEQFIGLLHISNRYYTAILAAYGKYKVFGSIFNLVFKETLLNFITLLSLIKNLFCTNIYLLF